MTTRSRNLIDPYQPTPARLHSVFLGGKDHYEPDEALAEALSSSTIRPAITESRRFTRRAVEYLSDHYGVSQFVELGCGLPHVPNIHDIAENLAARWDALEWPSPWCVIHGDPSPANTMAAPTGGHVVDLERCCIGPPQWDKPLSPSSPTHSRTHQPDGNSSPTPTAPMSPDGTATR
ncbi:SAM-dependent methyltransferase [Nocardia sp. NPDC058633]|uniref:SAM-dependent methyltransferase n=1 Tax=Nocardia sp. NPDC058633 TaxID=3346568 RepID=UPI00365BFD23